MKHIDKTNDIDMAFEFIKYSMPNLNVTKHNTAPILYLVEEGKLKVGNPVMYDCNAPLFKQNSFNYEDREVVTNWYVSLLKESSTSILEGVN